MRKLCLLALALAFAGTAFAAPNVTNATQKGSLMIWPDIRIDDGWNTLIRVQNDGGSDVDVICYYMDGNKNRVDFIFTITRNQAFWFDARTGNGTNQVNRFPQTPANGFDNPFLVTTGAPAEGIPWTTVPVAGATDDALPFFRGPYLKGLLACWAVDTGAQNQVKWNHLSGTATVYNPGLGAYEYNAYAFFVPTGLDLQPVGTAGVLNLNGVEYDSCPLYQIGQFTPITSPPTGALAGTLEPLRPPVVAPALPLLFGIHRLALAGCSLNLNQDWTPVFTRYVFDVWNEDEVKFTGAFECADSWHETTFLDPADPQAVGLGGATPGLQQAGGGIDSGAQNFQFPVLGTFSARYRVQGTASAQCNRAAATGQPAIVTQPVGVLGVDSAFVVLGAVRAIGETLTAAGKFNGRIVYDAAEIVPEGAIR